MHLPRDAGEVPDQYHASPTKVIFLEGKKGDKPKSALSSEHEAIKKKHLKEFKRCQSELDEMEEDISKLEIGGIEKPSTFAFY